VLEPILQTQGVVMTPRQLNIARSALTDSLSRKTGLRILEQASGPSAASVLGGVIVHRFQSLNESAAELFLRTYQVQASLNVRPLDGQETLLEITRTLTWQRAYPSLKDARPQEEDFALAVRELGALLAAGLTPEPVPNHLPPWDAAVDPATGLDISQSALRLGNQYAQAGSFEMARQLWDVVLFSPETGAEGAPSRFRISERVLNSARRHGLPPETAEALQSMIWMPPLNLEEFRFALRRMTNGRIAQEGLVVLLADQKMEHRYLNTAAAHGNLGTLFMLQGHMDFAAYHLARAYTENPAGGFGQRWIWLQISRGLVEEILPGTPHLAADQGVQKNAQGMTMNAAPAMDSAPVLNTPRNASPQQDASPVEAGTGLSPSKAKGSHPSASPLQLEYARILERYLRIPIPQGLSVHPGTREDLTLPPPALFSNVSISPSQPPPRSKP